MSTPATLTRRAPRADKHRRLRVEILGLPFCARCGGATVHTRDDELACVCLERHAALISRLRRLAEDHTPRARHWSDRY